MFVARTHYLKLDPPDASPQKCSLFVNTIENGYPKIAQIDFDLRLPELGVIAFVCFCNFIELMRLQSAQTNVGLVSHHVVAILRSSEAL